MKSFTYKVTVEMLTGATGEAVEREPLVFEAFNHDDILAIAKTVGARLPYGTDEGAQLAIGLKLLGEMALKYRNDELFAELRPALAAFIGRLKAA